MCDRPDDASISDGERLWRRILPQWVHPTPNAPPRPSSAAFKDNLSGEVSVFIAAISDADALIQAHSGAGVAEITAGMARAAGFKVVRDPDGGLFPNDPSHVVLCPPTDVGKKRLHRAARVLAEGATWAREPSRPG